MFGDYKEIQEIPAIVRKFKDNYNSNNFADSIEKMMTYNFVYLYLKTIVPGLTFGSLKSDVDFLKLVDQKEFIDFLIDAKNIS